MYVNMHRTNRLLNLVFLAQIHYKRCLANFEINVVTQFVNMMDRTHDFSPNATVTWPAAPSWVQREQLGQSFSGKKQAETLKRKENHVIILSHFSKALRILIKFMFLCSVSYKTLYWIKLRPNQLNSTGNSYSKSICVVLSLGSSYSIVHKQSAHIHVLKLQMWHRVRMRQTLGSVTVLCRDLIVLSSAMFSSGLPGLCWNAAKRTGKPWKCFLVSVKGPGPDFCEIKSV